MPVVVGAFRFESKQGYRDSHRQRELLTPTNNNPICGANDRLLDRPIDRRNPMHRTAASSCGQPRAAPVVLSLILLAWYSQQCSASADIERGSPFPEKQSNAVHVRNAACSAVRCVFKFVAAANAVLSLLSGTGGNRSVSALSVFVSATLVRFWFSAFLQWRGRSLLPWAWYLWRVQQPSMI